MFLCVRVRLCMFVGVSVGWWCTGVGSVSMHVVRMVI